MADLKHVFGGPFTPPRGGSLLPPEEQLRQAMIEAGLTPPTEIIFDGKIHRFASGTKQKPGRDDAGWYVVYPDNVPAGAFGCWRTGINRTWRADIGRQLSPQEEAIYRRRLEQARRARDEELARQQAEIKKEVARIWAQSPPAEPDHPYLRRKGIQPHGARVDQDGRLVVPLFAPDGSLSSLQYIAPDGSKKYHPGTRVRGCYWMIDFLMPEFMQEPGPLYVAEGFATAATVHEKTGRPCVIAYSANNLAPVMAALREYYGPSQDIIIIADNDASGVGQRYAEEAIQKYGGRYVMPPVVGDVNDYVQAGGDLLSLLAPLQPKRWLVPATELAKKPAPISWLIKSWLQDKALIMVYGPSGAGKTFLVLDWAMHIACSLPEWWGHKVSPGAVVYLAGEGHWGLRSRIAAWLEHYKPEQDPKLWVSMSGCDLNTPSGYAQAVGSIKQLPERPRLIIVDTLHRFLAGDENRADDTKTMLDSCAKLMQEFDCSILLVHHTGVSEEAQHRARGSSAWRAALDIEISVVPGEGDDPIQIIQRKSKDTEIARPKAIQLHQVAIPGWVDEDGVQATSAVVIESILPPPEEPKKKDWGTDKLTDYKRTFENAWAASGMEVRDGYPYLNRNNLFDFLVNKMGYSKSTAKVYISPGTPGKLIHELIQARIIEAYKDGRGWIVIDERWSSAMLTLKNIKPATPSHRMSPPKESPQEFDDPF